MKPNLPEDHWVANPACSEPSDNDNLLIDNRDKVCLVAECSNANLSWEYDETAVVYLRDHGWFLLGTSGCSCPSPNETWGAERFASKKALLKHIRAQVDKHNKGEYVHSASYWTPEFIAAIEAAK